MTLMFSETGLAAMHQFPGDSGPDAEERYDSFAILEAAVKECQADGVLDSAVDTGALSLVVWSLVHGLAYIEERDSWTTWAK